MDLRVLVGEVVGTSDGLRERFLVGAIEEGTIVSKLVGIAVGPKDDGEFEGCLVGIIVLGIREGRFDGDSVGKDEGDKDGVWVGRPVETKVGGSEGDDVGK